jgi:hypothetical protein
MPHAWATTRATINSSGITFPGGVSADRAFLLDGRLNRRISGTPGTSFNIDFDFGAATALVGFGVLNHNFCSLGTAAVTISGADDAAFSVGLVVAKAASTFAPGRSPLDPRAKDHVFRFPGLSKRYWRLACSFGVSTTPIVGELFPMATASTFQLARTTIYGAGEAEEFMTSGLVLDSGDDRRRFIAGPIRSLKLPFQDLTLAQKDQLLSMWAATRGGSTPLLWVAQDNPTSVAATSAEQDCLFGLLGQEQGWSQPDFALYDTQALALKSLGREVGA